MRLASAFLAVVAIADATRFGQPIVGPDADVSASSETGRELLSKARRLQANNYNYNYNYNRNQNQNQNRDQDQDQEQEQENYYENRDNQENYRTSQYNRDDYASNTYQYQAQRSYYQNANANGNNYNNNNNNNNNKNYNNNGGNSYSVSNGGSSYSGSGNAASNVEAYMENVGYYTRTRDQNWHYYDSYGRANGNYWYNGGNDNEYESNWYGDEWDANPWDNQENDASGQYSQYNGMGNGGGDTSWMSDYSIKFDGCTREYNEATSMLLAKFKLCPNTSGSKCRHAGQYVIPMDDFVEAYASVVQVDDGCQMQLAICSSKCQADMYAYGNYDDDAEYAGGNGNNRKLDNNYQNMDYEEQMEYMYGQQACMDNCMVANNMASCGTNNDASQTAALTKLVQCQTVDSDSAQPYYVGATCREGGVFLDVFTDSSCKHAVTDGNQQSILGFSLPEQDLVTTSLVECTGYMRDSSYQAAAGICQGLYYDAAKCEKHMSGSHKKNNGGCAYMRHLDAKRNAALAGTIIAIILLSACLALAAYIWHLRRQGKNASLSSVMQSGRDAISRMMPRRKLPSRIPSRMAPGGKTLSERLHVTPPTADDTKTVASNDESAARYEGGKMDTEPKSPADKTGDIL